jgi:hypothetical protein
MLRRFVVGFGLATILFGVWLLGRVHSEVGVCNVINGSNAGSTSGPRSGCVGILMSYTEGFVFVAAGLVIVVIAFTMISRRERLDLRSELRAVATDMEETRLHGQQRAGADREGRDVAAQSSGVHRQPLKINLSRA